MNNLVSCIRMKFKILNSNFGCVVHNEIERPDYVLSLFVYSEQQF